MTAGQGAPAEQPSDEPVATGWSSATETEPAPPTTPTDPLAIFAVEEHAAEASQATEQSDLAAAEDAAPVRATSAWDIPPMVDPAESITTEAAEAPDESAINWGLAPRTRRSTAANTATGAGATSLSTVWTWLIAVSPVIAAITVGYVLASAGASFGNWMLPVALVVPYLLVLLFAVADRSALTTAGHEDLVPWTWAALTAPVYLYMRMGFVRREGGRGTTPLIAWAIFFVLAILGLFGYGLISGHSLFSGTAG